MPLQFRSLQSNNSALVAKAITKHPFYKTVHIIADPESNISLPSASFHTLETSDLYNIIQEKHLEDVCIKAIPTDQTPELPEFQNTLLLNKDTITINLDQASFQKCPNLQSRNKGTIRKLQHAKVGHGGNYHARYRFEIKCQPTILELEYIIKTLFSTANVSIYSNASTSTKISDQNGTIHSEKSTAKIPDCSLLDIFERYELLTLSTNFDQLQILHQDDELETNYFTRYTLLNVISSALLKTKWHILSLQGENTHTLLQVKGDRIDIYEVL